MNARPYSSLSPTDRLIHLLKDVTGFEEDLLATNANEGAEDALNAALLQYVPHVPNRRNEQWVDRFLQLYKFCLEHERLPRNKDDSSLYQWVNLQKTDEDLPLARKELLNSLPEWKATPNARWLGSYEELRKGMSRTGDFPPHLYEWGRMQKIAYRKGELEEEKVKLLNKVPKWTWLNTHEKAWLDHAKSMIRFISREQRWPTANGDKRRIENRLYHWWYRQGKNTDPRKQPVIDCLSAEKKQLQANLAISDKKILMNLVEQARRDMENNPEKSKDNDESTTENSGIF